MSKNRKAAEKLALDVIGAIDPSGKNIELYKKRFKAMSDREFGDWMKAIRDGKNTPSIVIPNQSNHKLDASRNVKIAEKYLGHKFFQRLWLTDNATGEKYLTPHKYLVVDLPLRRQAQLLIKKLSVPGTNATVDALTGQPTGPSKGSTLSFPELQVLAALDMDKTIEELIKVRGGDTAAFNAFNNKILETGHGSLDQVAALGTRPRSTETLSILLKGMHLDNNL